MAATLVTALLAAASCPAQTWEYSPYQIHVWLAFGTSPELSSELHSHIAKKIVQRGRVLAGATWNLYPQQPPTPQMRTDIVHSIEAVTFDQVAAAVGKDPLQPGLIAEQPVGEAPSPNRGSLAAEVLRADKLILLSVDADGLGFMLQARELDIHTRQWGTVVRRSVYQPALVANTAFDTMAKAFSPLVRIEQNAGRSATARLRAGGLVTDPFCPSLIPVGGVLQPVIRRNDRAGNPRPDGISLVQWTYLRVDQQTGAALQCTIHSGLRSPLGGRSSVRVEKLALGISPTLPQTMLKLTTRGDAPRPLAGYEIYARDPITDESQRIGQTDWRGAVVVEKVDAPLRLIYVKNGGLLLARLPMVPGHYGTLTAQMADDEDRLQAEAFVRGLQRTVMDLVAQREELAVRVRKQITAGKVDEAQQLLDQFRALKTMTELDSLLDQQKNDLFSNDRRTQARIDKLFSDTHEVLVKYLDPRLGDQLAAEIAQARQGE